MGAGYGQHKSRAFMLPSGVASQTRPGVPDWLRALEEPGLKALTLRDVKVRREDERCSLSYCACLMIFGKEPQHG